MNYSILKQYSLKLFDNTFFVLHPNLVRHRIYRNHKRLNWGNINQLHLEPELLIAPKLIQSGETFIDIGANKGEYIYCIQQQHPNVKCYGFEPIPVSYERLKRLLPQVKILPYAVSNTIGTAEFKIPIIGYREFPTRGTLRLDHTETNEIAQKRFQVNLITVDQFVQQEELKAVRLIKVDVEGNECAVLEGAKQTLRTMKPALIVEIEQRHHPGKPIREIVDYITQFGYQSLYFDRVSLTLNRADSLFDIQQDRTQRFPSNYIFLPQEVDITELQHEVANDIVSYLAV